MPKHMVPFDVPPNLVLLKHWKKRKTNPFRRQTAPAAVAVPPCPGKDISEGVCPLCGFTFPKDTRSVRIGGRLTGAVVAVPVWVPHPKFQGEQAGKYLAHHPALATRREEHA